jgi:hypothetical protein
MTWTVAVVDVASRSRLAFYGTANIDRWLTTLLTSSSIVTTIFAKEFRSLSFSGHHPRLRSTMSNKGLEALANIASASQISERGEVSTDNGGGDGSKPAAQQAELSSSTAPPTPSLGASLNSLTSSLATTQQLQQLLNVAGISQSLQSTANNMNLLGLHHHHHHQQQQQQQQQQQPQQATDPALLLSQLSQIAQLQQMLGRSQQPQGTINPFVSNYGGNNQQEMAAGECRKGFAFAADSTESVPHGAWRRVEGGRTAV